jgi:hypothetical protein
MMMNKILDYAKFAYSTTVLVSPVLGANYCVYEGLKRGQNTDNSFVNAVLGSFFGAACGILSPCIIFALPAYFATKVIKRNNF